MKNGILIFAHNSKDIDYVLMSLISGGLAKKYLNVPVSLVTDISTIDWMKTSNIYNKALKIFENIIEIESPKSVNKRKLHDGIDANMVSFINDSRIMAYDLTPYDKTLLIDSDFLIFSNALNEYWMSEEVLISREMKDLYDKSRAGQHDLYVSDTGVHLYWATTVMFTKNETGKRFFDLLKFVKDHYQYYGDLFRFSTNQYRNDISFSVTKHILDGFETDTNQTLPPVLTTLDRDILHSVNSNGKLTFLLNGNMDLNFCAATISNTDIHIMNKQSIIRNAKSLLELI